MTKILLVEDDKSLREIYGVRLLAEGYDIVSAGDGEEALAMAIKERPDLIVSDVMMPKISGFDMLDILRSTTETKNIKVIMMTALSSEDQRQRGESLGADRYLVKSQVGIEDVVRTVHEVLGDAPISAGSNQNVFSTPSRTVQPARPTDNPTPASPSVPPSAPGAPANPASTSAPKPPVPAPPASGMPNQSPSGSSPVSHPASSPVSPNHPPAQGQPTTSSPPPSAPGTPANPASPGAPKPPVPPAPKPVNQDTPTGSSLPQPTAPFSTNRPAGLGDRIIQPLQRSTPKTDMSSLMDKELNSPSPTPFPPTDNKAPDQSQPSAPAAVPPQPQQHAPTPPQQAQAPNLNFEETPLPPKPPVPPSPTS